MRLTFYSESCLHMASTAQYAPYRHLITMQCRQDLCGLFLTTFRLSAAKSISDAVSRYAPQRSVEACATLWQGASTRGKPARQRLSAQVHSENKERRGKYDYSYRRCGPPCHTFGAWIRAKFNPRCKFNRRDKGATAHGVWCYGNDSRPGALCAHRSCAHLSNCEYRRIHTPATRDSRHRYRRVSSCTSPPPLLVHLRRPPRTVFLLHLYREPPAIC